MSSGRNVQVKVLLVDDNESDVKITLKALRNGGLDVDEVVFGDGLEAMEYLDVRASQDESLPDVILLDINMPKMDGHSFVQDIRRKEDLKDIPVIVFTTKEGMEDIFKVEGISDYVIKSPNATDLIDKIKKHLLLS